MIQSLEAERLPSRKRARLGTSASQTGAVASSHRPSSTLWWHCAAALCVAYIMASQALLDFQGWSRSAFVLAALLSLILVAGSFFRVWKLHLGTWIVSPLLFLCYCLLRCFSGVKETAPFDTFAQLASAFLGAVALALALRVGVSFKALVYAQVAVNFLQIVIVLSGLGPEPPPGDETFRYAGLTGNPNLLALQLTLGACLIWLSPRKVGFLACAFAVAAVVFAVAVTGSRKSLLTSLFFLILVFVQSVALVPRKRRRLMVALAVATACLAGFFLAHWIHQNGTGILAVRRALEYDDSSYRTRSEMIEQGLKLWEHAPIFGNGLDAFRGLSGQGTYSHNNYVELLCDLGLVGVLLFYSLHVQALIRAIRISPLLRLYCSIFVLMLVLVDVGYVSYTSKQSIMILMLLTTMTSSRYRFLSRRHSRKSSRDHHRVTKPHRRCFIMQT